MTSKTPTNPFSPPDAWVEILRKLPELEKPRILVALSAGRGAYRPVVDICPEVSRLVQDEADPKRDLVTIHLGQDYTPGDCRDTAETIYSEACRMFLDTRRGDGSSFIKVGRIRLKLIDGADEVGSDSLEVTREAFGVEDDVVVQTGGAQGDALRIIGEHSKSVGAQFISLAKHSGEQAERERAGILDYARGALQLTKEAGDLRAEAVAALAESQRVGWANSDVGVAIVGGVLENLPKGLDILDKYLDCRREEARARRAEADRDRERPSTPPPPSSASYTPPPTPGGRKRRGDAS